MPAEIIKVSKPVLNTDLQNLLIRCLEVGKIPQDLKDASIVMLYKYKETVVTVTTT